MPLQDSPYRYLGPKGIVPFAALLLVILTFLAYRPGLNGPFLFDDEPNITRNQAVQLDELSWNGLAAASLSYQDALFKRPISMSSLGLNYYFTGPSAFGFKLVNLLIHLLNGIALFVLVRGLLLALSRRGVLALPESRIAWLSLAVTAAWLLHPINLTSVLYVVQRMTSISAFFSLWGMALYVKGRLALNDGRPVFGGALIVAGLLGGTVLAVLGKENGALLPLFLFVIEWTVFRFETPTTRGRRSLQALMIVVVGLPAVASLVFLVTHWDWLAGSYASRTFTIDERLLTEPRVIWLYLKLLLLPVPGEFTLFHDDIPLSTGWLAPIGTLSAALGVVALAGAAVWSRNKAPVLAFGILFFLGGHAMESTFIPLEIAHEHRNYLPGVGILLIIVYYLFVLCERIEHKPIGYAATAILIGLYGISTAGRAHSWANAVDLAHVEAYHHPSSARSQYELGRVYLQLMDVDPRRTQEYASAAWARLEKAAKLDSAQAPGSQLAMLYLAAKQTELLADLPWHELIEGLARNPVVPLTVSNLVKLIECLSARECELPAGRLEELLQASLSNPTLTNKYRGQILAAAADYAFKVPDLPAAVRYAREAVAVYPQHSQHHLNLAYLLVFEGKLQEAGEILTHLEKSDQFGEFKEKRQNLAALVEANRERPRRAAIP